MHVITYNVMYKLYIYLLFKYCIYGLMMFDSTDNCSYCTVKLD